MDLVNFLLTTSSFSNIYYQNVFVIHQKISFFYKIITMLQNIRNFNQSKMFVANVLKVGTVMLTHT